MEEKKMEAPFCTLENALDAEHVKKQIRHHLLSSLGRDPQRAGKSDMCKAVSYVVRDILIERWIKTQKSYYDKQRKRVYYLSLEFLVGRSLGNALINLGLFDEVGKIVEELGYDLEEVQEREDDAALGNGGLGRLAACFLDSMATMGIPAYGYGIRYEYGLFYQRLLNGEQVEYPDNWLRYGSPWELVRPQHLHPINFYGRVRKYSDHEGRSRSEWIDTEEVMAMACDMLVPGFQVEHVINMRLWTAKASRELDLSSFNRGDYLGAVESKVRSETLSKVLYPTDIGPQGQELRLKQQYFFVAATFQDIFRRFRDNKAAIAKLSEHIAVQLNDTHPAIAIPELMRLLIDIEGMEWQKAWEICVNTFGYTNHTLMPEALEVWPVKLLGRLLPRHLEIIYEINHLFLQLVEKKYPGDGGKLRQLSIIDERDDKFVRMAHLAIVGSHSVNGVARLHTHLLKTRLFRDFDALFPGRFNCKTNGITPRRWLLKCNAGLADLITETIGGEWVSNLDHLKGLEAVADDPEFQRRWRVVKQTSKQNLARLIKDQCGVEVESHSMFDVQVKRIHEYKRQLLNVLHVITLYRRLLNNPDYYRPPRRTVIFAGKAAPSYLKAKLIIKLINSVAEVVNGDSRLDGRLRLVFIPNYGVSLAEKIIPAADLSEQISVAGTEASGTGNMKFALNGALTIGTLDGANIEIMEEVGDDNIFIFGLNAVEAEDERRHRTRLPADIYAAVPEIRDTIDSIRDGLFSGGDNKIFMPIVDDLLSPNDPYLSLADLEDYLRCQQEVEETYKNQRSWTRKSILNVARIGKFSSDRAIMEYARDIWGLSLS